MRLEDIKRWVHNEIIKCDSNCINDPFLYEIYEFTKQFNPLNIEDGPRVYNFQKPVRENSGLKGEYILGLWISNKYSKRLIDSKEFDPVLLMRWFEDVVEHPERGSMQYDTAVKFLIAMYEKDLNENQLILYQRSKDIVMNELISFLVEHSQPGYYVEIEDDLLNSNMKYSCYKGFKFLIQENKNWINKNRELIKNLYSGIKKINDVGIEKIFPVGTYEWHEITAGFEKLEDVYKKYVELKHRRGNGKIIEYHILAKFVEECLLKLDRNETDVVDENGRIKPLNLAKLLAGTAIQSNPKIIERHIRRLFNNWAWHRQSEHIEINRDVDNRKRKIYFMSVTQLIE